MALPNGFGRPVIKRGWVRALLLFICYLSAFMLTGVLVGLYTPAKKLGPQPTSESIFTIEMILSSLLSVAIVFIFRRYVDRRSFKSIEIFLSRFYPDGVIGLLTGTFLVCAGGWLIFLSGGLLWTGVLFSGDIFLNGALLLLVAFSEELVFRGYILRSLMKSFPPMLSLAISALLFALVHLTNPGIPPAGIVNTILGGLLLGIMFINTRSLWMPVMLHFSWNFLQGPLLGFPVSGFAFRSALSTSLLGSDLVNGGSFGFEGSVICTALLLVAFLVFFFSKRFHRMQKAIDGTPAVGRQINF